MSTVRAPRMAAADRRDHLLDAALRLIVEHGYRGVTMEAVAREAQIAKPVVYRQFANAGELLRALLQREESRVLTQLAAVVPQVTQDHRPDELLVQGLGAFLEAVLAAPEAWRLILRPTDETPEIVREHVRSNRARVRGQVEALVEWGAPRLGWGDDLDTELAARAVVALCEQTALLALAQPAAFPPDRLTAFAGRLVRGLSG